MANISFRFYFSTMKIPGKNVKLKNGTKNGTKIKLIYASSITILLNWIYVAVLLKLKFNLIKDE